jgi:hypothetical protein
LAASRKIPPAIGIIRSRRTWHRHNSRIDHKEARVEEEDDSPDDRDMHEWAGSLMNDDDHFAPVAASASAAADTRRRVRPIMAAGGDLNTSNSSVPTDSESDESLHDEAEEEEEDDDDEDRVEDELVVPPFLPADIVALLPKPVGRPPMKIDLDSRLFPNAPTPISSLLHELMSVLNDFNTPEAMRIRVYALLRAHISSNFPSYHRAKSLLLEHINKPDKYPACIDDCYVHNITIGQIKPDDFKTLECPRCHKKLADAKGRAKKVSSVPSPSLRRSW